MKIILAVSGGVDSVCMLHAWRYNSDFLSTLEDISYENTKVMVAHFDHGIRSDSSADARFVEAVSDRCGYKFVLGHGHLAKNTSEAVARKARFDFLRSLLKNKGDTIATAHHFDDKRETQIINLLRGTNRKGMSVLQNTGEIIRPLIDKSKAEIYEYALKNNLEWVEDSTNLSDEYLRNRLRRHYMPALMNNKILWDSIDNVDLLNAEIESLLDKIKVNVLMGESTIVRKQYLSLPKPIRLNILEPIYSQLLHATSEKQKLTRARLEQLDDWICDLSKNHKRDIAGKIVVELANNAVTLKAK
jgi:tRNA(Ile)-lysidine synthase